MSAARRITEKQKSDKAFRSIGEAAQEVSLPTHVLRFWETKFSVLKPVKRKDGRRMYRPDDIRALFAIRSLVHDQGLTIKGAQKILKAQGVAAVLDGEARLGSSVRDVIDPAEFQSPAANPVQKLQKTVNDVVESGVFSKGAEAGESRLSTLLSELDSVKSRLDAVLEKKVA